MSHEIVSTSPLESLYTKTSVLLTGMLALGTTGALLSPSVPFGLFVVLSLVWLFLTIGVVFSAASVKFSKQTSDKPHNPTLALSITAVWTALSGVVSGPALHMYDAKLGTDTVLAVFMGCVLAAAVCGTFGFLSRRNFDNLRGILSLSLWGLILVGIIAAFFTLTPVAEMWISGITIVVFCGYFVVDFNRLRQEREAGENDWGTAILMATALYLDLLNMFFAALRFITAWKSE